MQKPFSTQPDLFVSTADLEHPILHSLDDTEALLEWSEIEKLLSSIYSSSTGRPIYPLLTLFRSLLLGGDVPEASTLGRFRTRLVEHDLWDQLLGEINRQLEVKNIIMKEGCINIIDATPIEAVQSGPSNGKDGKPKKDPQAGWHVKNDSRGNKKSIYGFSVHTDVDEDGFIHRQSVTSGNVHDSQERNTILLGDETALYADAAYSSQQTRDKLAKYGIDDQVQRKGYRGKPL